MDELKVIDSDSDSDAVAVTLSASDSDSDSNMTLAVSLKDDTLANIGVNQTDSDIAEEGLKNNHECLTNECFKDTFILMGMAALASAGLCVALYYRTLHIYQKLHKQAVIDSKLRQHYKDIFSIKKVVLTNI